jgi:hypothetical protein
MILLSNTRRLGINNYSHSLVKVNSVQNETDGDITQMTKKMTLAVIFGLIVTALSFVHATASDKKSDLIVSIDAKNQPLSEVLTDISKQTAWTVVIDDRLIDKPISGKYKDIGLESLLKRTLKGEALIVLYDEVAKSVDIRSFSEPSKMVTINSNSPLPVMPDQKQLEELRIEEQRGYDEYVSNPDSVEPLTGMTLGEIAALKTAEDKAYKDYISNPNSVEPLSGMKLSDIKVLHANEQKAYDAYKSDPDSIEPLTGMKLGEIAALQNIGQKSADDSNSVPNLIAQ